MDERANGTVFSEWTGIPNVHAAEPEVLSTTSPDAAEPHPMLTEKNKKINKKRVKRKKTKEKKLTNLKIYYVNIRGIRSKIVSLEEILERTKPDVLGIVETHLEEGEELEIEGYNCIRKDRNKDGGGVLIAIRKEYERKELGDVMV